MSPIPPNPGRSRRWFLVNAIGAPAMVMAAEACARRVQRSERVGSAPSPLLSAEERSVLRLVIDELIPTADGMPAAGEVGSLEYLEQLARDHSEVQGELETALASLAKLSSDVFAAPFTSLSRPERVQALSTMEKRAPREFASLRDYTYEAYYTRPQVWRLIGYGGNSTPGEHWNDDALLAPVRAMPRLYRLVM